MILNAICLALTFFILGECAVMVTKAVRAEDRRRGDGIE